MTTPTPAPTPSAHPELDAAVAALDADTEALQADIAELPTLDDDGGPRTRPRRRNHASADDDGDSVDGETEPGPSHPSRMPAQWWHPHGPWGDTPAQSRTN